VAGHRAPYSNTNVSSRRGIAQTTSVLPVTATVVGCARLRNVTTHDQSATASGNLALTMPAENLPFSNLDVPILAGLVPYPGGPAPIGKAVSAGAKVLR
jgi:hypothetical protein